MAGLVLLVVSFILAVVGKLISIHLQRKAFECADLMISEIALKYKSRGIAWSMVYEVDEVRTTLHILRTCVYIIYVYIIHSYVMYH